MLGVLCSRLTALLCWTAAVAPVSAQTPWVWPNEPQVEVAIGPGQVAGDADHAAVALAPNGDFLVAFRVDSGSADAVEVHACYFTLERAGGVHWVPGPTQVLGAVDAEGRACTRVDVVATHAPGSTDPHFLVVWGRRNEGAVRGALEAAVVLPPAAAGDAARTVHTDGIQGVALDADLNALGGGVRPRLVWHPSLGRGRAGVVYNHRAHISASEVRLDLRWREFELGEQPGFGQVLVATTLVSDVTLTGTLFERPGGYLPADAILMDRPAPSTELRLTVGHEESADWSGFDSSRILLRSYHFTAGAPPVVDGVDIIPPGPAASDRYPRRPRLAWDGSDPLTLQVAHYTAEALGSKVLRAHAHRRHWDARGLERLDWNPGADLSVQPTPFAVPGRHGAVYNDARHLHAALENPRGGLTDLATPLAVGQVPALAWLADVGPAGNAVFAVVSHSPSPTLPGGAARVHVGVRLLN